MTSVPDKIAEGAWRLCPARLEHFLRTEAGKRFGRFILVALAAVITSQVVLGLLTGPVNWTAGASGVVASMVAALVSYILSRWAWERKGKPDLLRETLPFWIVSIAVWGILGLTSHYSSVWAHSMGYTHLMKHLVVQGSYFIMNCVTFLLRFLIFHYFLFNDRGRKAVVAAAPDLATAEVMAEAEDSDTGPLAMLGSDSNRSGPGGGR